MVDYLSRHPSSYEGEIVKLEQMFNNWTIAIVVKEIVHYGQIGK